MRDTPIILKDVYTLLQSKSCLWDRIGRGLNVGHDYRQSLFRQGVMLDDDGKLESVLAKWIESQCSATTWEHLFQVLLQLEFRDVAEKMEKFLCP